jgi:hypothetical protein
MGRKTLRYKSSVIDNYNYLRNYLVSSHFIFFVLSLGIQSTRYSTTFNKQSKQQLHNSMFCSAGERFVQGKKKSLRIKEASQISVP